MRKSVRIQGIVLLLLICVVCVIFYAAWREDARGRLTVSFLNVGDGSAIYIEAPSGRHILVDGGPDGSALRRLGQVMPPWDRSLDVIVASSADAGAVTGLVDVLQRYTVGTVVQSGVENTSPMWNLFEKEAADAAGSANIRTARRGEALDLGKGAYMEILFPDRPLSAAGTGEGCVVARLVYGTTSFLLACNATAGVQNYLAMLDGAKLKSDVLLYRGTLSPLFVGYAAPSYAVQSRGCDTKSTPSAQTEAIFTTFSTQTLDTCDDGTVTFVSDGTAVVRD